MFKKLLSKRGLSFDRLRALLELAEYGSLARAAQGDPVRQSQFSRQIKELEDYFGVELTRRHGHLLKLTDAGTHLVEIARESFLSLGNFQASCEKHPLPIVIGGVDSLLQWLLLPRLKALRRVLPPNTTISIRQQQSEETATELSELRLDFGLIRESALQAPLACAGLFKLEYALFVPKALLTPKRSSDFRVVLEEHPLALQASGGQFSKEVEQSARKQGVKLNIALRCTSFLQAAHAVQTSEFVAILPTIAAADLDAARFAQLPLPMLKSYRRIICLAWNPRLLRLRPELEKCRKYLAKNLRSSRAEETPNAEV